MAGEPSWARFFSVVPGNSTGGDREEVMRTKLHLNMRESFSPVQVCRNREQAVSSLEILQNGPCAVPWHLWDPVFPPRHRVSVGTPALSPHTRAPHGSGTLPCPRLGTARRTELITGAEDTVKQSQALPVPLLLVFDLQLLVLPKDNGLKNYPSSFFSPHILCFI